MLMSCLNADDTVAQLAALQAEMLRAFVERRRQRQEGDPTRLQEFALRAIRDKDGLQVSALASLLEISAPTASQLLTVLEERGWVGREILPEDRRRHQITITAEGREMLREVDTRRRQRFAQVLTQLTAQERADLVRIARRVLEVVRDSSGEVF